jgi:hypothetical protein
MPEVLFMMIGWTFLLQFERIKNRESFAKVVGEARGSIRSVKLRNPERGRCKIGVSQYITRA